MNKLVLSALLVMASLAQAANGAFSTQVFGVASQRASEFFPGIEDGAISQPGEFFPPVGRGAVSDGQNFETIAQVAGEAAQLLPSTRLGASPTMKRLRGASPARAMTPSPTTAVVNADRFKASTLQSKYMNDAEQFAKANGCPAPVATMKLAVVGPENFEAFAVTCGADVSLSIRCDSGRCRAM